VVSEAHRGARVWRRPSVDMERLIDVMSVVLISLATVFSAWCGYMASQFGNLQSRAFNEASALHIEASEARDRGNAALSIQVNLFVQYLSAVSLGRKDFAEFLRGHFPPELKAATDAWQATHPLENPNAPHSPFEMSSFHVPGESEARDYNGRASAAVARAIESAKRSDAFVLLTVIFASVSFLGGVGAKMRYPMNLLLLCFGVVVLLAGTAYMHHLHGLPRL
jgi:hypothetical protein